MISHSHTWSFPRRRYYAQAVKNCALAVVAGDDEEQVSLGFEATATQGDPEDIEATE